MICLLSKKENFSFQKNLRKSKNQKEEKEREASKEKSPETAHFFDFLMLQEIVQQLRSRSEKIKVVFPEKTEPWTQKVAIRPSAAMLV